MAVPPPPAAEIPPTRKIQYRSHRDSLFDIRTNAAIRAPGRGTNTSAVATAPTPVKTVLHIRTSPCFFRISFDNDVISSNCSLRT